MILFLQNLDNFDNACVAVEEFNYVLSVGDFLVFRGTDGYPFNLLELTEKHLIDDLSPRKKN